MKKYKILSVLSVLFIFLVLSVSCHKEKKKIQKTEETENLPEDIVEMREDQIKLAEIEMGSIEYHSLSGVLKVSGKVASSPQNIASVSVPLGGIVRSTTLMPGNYVSKGQRLAVIENPEYIDIQQNYLEAKSKLEYTEADYNRQKELFQNDVTSQKNMQLVKSEYKSLKVQVSALRQKLSLIGINPDRLTENNITRSIALVSPISGYIKVVNANIGKSVSESDVLFEIVNMNKLFLELTLFDKDIDKVSVGQKINFLMNNETEQHDAVIYQTAKAMDSDKTYKIYANITSTCKNVIPGMYVNAAIETSTNNTACVPTEAVVNFDDKDYIFVLVKNKKENGFNFTEYRMVEVQKGVSAGNYIGITLPSEIKPDEIKIAVKGAYNLLSAKKNAGEMAC
ncbi:MAG: efflux RND transporter periplasmic adaptor subunit [Paludibacteraceae bacterium]